MSEEYASGLHDTETIEETTDYSEEAAAEQENPTIIYFAYGVIHVWMTILGYIIFSYYPGLMSSNAWWKLQCPSSLYTID